MRLRIGVSACLIGQKCNFNGEDLLSKFVSQLAENSQIELVPFCPEDFMFGTPRPNLRIVGGDGESVLDGKAKVIDEAEQDVTEKQIQAAHKFLETLLMENVEYAILMEGSPSCGSNILLSENDWPRGGFKKGVGVAAALLRRNGIHVFGGFDERSINQFLSSKTNEVEINSGLEDLRDKPKFKTLFENQ